jgi:hypothetical protein
VPVATASGGHSRTTTVDPREALSCAIGEHQARTTRPDAFQAWDPWVLIGANRGKPKPRGRLRLILAVVGRTKFMADSPTGGPTDPLPRQPMDPAAYERRSREGPCFVCRTLAGDPNYPGHFVWTDDHAVAFLARYNTLLGHTLVAPRAHREKVTGDFSVKEYLDLQRLVYRVGRGNPPGAAHRAALHHESGQPVRKPTRSLARGTAATRRSLPRAAVRRLLLGPRPPRLAG